MKVKSPDREEVATAIRALLTKQIDFDAFKSRLGTLVPRDPLELEVFEAKFLHASNPALAIEKLMATFRRAQRRKRVRTAVGCLSELQLLYSRTGQHDLAVRTCRRIVRWKPTVDALLFLAGAEEQVGNLQASKRAYVRILQRRDSQRETVAFAKDEIARLDAKAL